MQDTTLHLFKRGFGGSLRLLAVLRFGGRSSDDFDLPRHSVPLDQVGSGGPGKDGIPAIMKPISVPSSEAGFLREEDRVLGMSLDREAKAYPVEILNWHEIVDDVIGGSPGVVIYCPLCGRGIAFEAAIIRGRARTFGVSGLLYQSDLLTPLMRMDGHYLQL